MSSRPYSRLGGDAVLDLVNTVSWRLDPDRRFDRLVEFAEAVRCLRELGLLSSTEEADIRMLADAAPRAAAAEFRRLLQLREALYGVVTGQPGSLAELTRQYAEFAAAATLDASEDGVEWTLPVDLTLPRLRAAKQAIDLVLRESPARLRRCDDDACGWVFLDGSPRRNRRWCDSADCGNRNRVRAHYERTRAATS